MNFFEVSALCAGYGGRPVLDALSFTVPEGSVTGVLGLNGSGKSTLIRAICGILPHSGRCLLRGQALEELPPRKLAQRCGYIPQRSGISVELPALDVVLMGFNPQLRLLEQPGPAMQARAREALAQVGLAGRETEPFLSLSEGEKQLCMLARALLCEGNLLLLDEPESALDFPHRYRLMALLRSWVSAQPRAALVILHDPMLALDCCDRLLLLHEGRIAGRLLPGSDDPEAMETALRQLYGPLRLLRCPDHAGRMHLLMLREED